MTAMSAEAPTNAEPAPAERTHVLLMGTPETYRVRRWLTKIGMTWIPQDQGWEGNVTSGQIWFLTEKLHIPVTLWPQELAKRQPAPEGATCPPVAPSGPRGPERRPHGGFWTSLGDSSAPRSCGPGTRTHVEASLAFGHGFDDDEDGFDFGLISWPSPSAEDGRPLRSRRFSVSDSPGGVGRVLAENRRAFSALDVTSGLPEDAREEDERQAAAQLRDLRGRVKAARAAISGNPGAEEVLAKDWVKEARFYARFGITQAQFRHGVATVEEAGIDLLQQLRSPCDWLSEVRAREAACLPSSEAFA